MGKIITILPDSSMVTDERWLFCVLEWLDADGQDFAEVFDDTQSRLTAINRLPDDTEKIVVYFLESDTPSKSEALHYVGACPRINED